MDIYKELKAYFDGVIEYDKTSLKERIININNSLLPELEINFEKNIENVLKKIKFCDEKGIIIGDYSYFIGVIIIFN